MNQRWRITIAVWPHSTGNGQEADLKAAGADDGDRYFYVTAEDFGMAAKMADCFSQGIKSHPAVWEAPIIAINRCDKL
jgi:hypothetical protein